VAIYPRFGGFNSLFRIIWGKVRIISPHNTYRHDTIPCLTLCQHANLAHHQILSRMNRSERAELRLTLASLLRPSYMKVPKTQPIGALSSRTAQSTWSSLKSETKSFLEAPLWGTPVFGLMFLLGSAITCPELIFSCNAPQLASQLSLMVPLSLWEALHHLRLSAISFVVLARAGNNELKMDLL